MTAGVPTEFIAPGPQSFETPPIIDGVDWFTKPVLVSALTVVVILWFFWGASRKAAVVPSRLVRGSGDVMRHRPDADVIQDGGC